jgi:hypothetical protein
MGEKALGGAELFSVNETPILRLVRLGEVVLLDARFQRIDTDFDNFIKNLYRIFLRGRSMRCCCVIRKWRKRKPIHGKMPASAAWLRISNQTR